jgi:hypothetical protein
MSRYNRPISSAEQILYNHLLYWVNQESTIAMLERVRTLFVDSISYPDPEVAHALRQIAASEFAEEDFRFVLNRCCHILINHWQARPQSRMAIPQLIALFEMPPSTSTVSALHSRSLRRLRHLIQQFTQTEQYLTLRRLAQVLVEAEASVDVGQHPLGTLIRRYPYLYEHCLLSEDSAEEQQHTVRQLQSVIQHQFELDLSRYVTYQVRRSQLLQTPTPDRIIQPVTNPTLLNEQELGQAIRHYVGRVDGCRTHRDHALNFLTHTGQMRSFSRFKDDLYQYITAAVDPAYGSRKFNRQLYHCLKSTLPESNSHQLTDFLLIRTCTHLLNFLVADNQSHPNHFVFVDLLNNLGPVITTGLLLRIVLLCRKVKPYLEKRLSLLFGHYEGYSRDAVHWLIQALENLNIALTTNFGSVNLSLLH